MWWLLFPARSTLHRARHWWEDIWTVEPEHQVPLEDGDAADRQQGSLRGKVGQRCDTVRASAGGAD